MTNRNDKHKETNADKANEEINEAFYGDDREANPDDNHHTSKTENVNNALNEALGENKEQKGTDMPVYGANNTPTVRIGKDKKDRR